MAAMRRAKSKALAYVVGRGERFKDTDPDLAFILINGIERPRLELLRGVFI